MNRVLRTELRRGGAPLLAVALAVVGALLLGSRLPRFSHYDSWTIGWDAAAGWMNEVGVVFGPVAGTVGAWVGGREHRWGTGELLATTPRPRWRRHVLTLAALGSATVLGFAATVLLVAAAQFRASTYHGGDWPLVLLLTALGLLVCLAWGWVAGRLLPRRLTAPVAGALMYVGFGIASYSSGRWANLVPVAHLEHRTYARFAPGVPGWFAVWLAALASGAVVPVVARRRRWVLVPVVAAVLAASLLAQVQGDASWPRWTREDPAGQQQVCTADEPVVCVTRAHQALLPAVTPVARELVREMSPVVAFTRAEESPSGETGPGVLALGDLERSGRAFSTDLAAPAGLARQAVSTMLAVQCAVWPDDLVDPTWDLAPVAGRILLPEDPAVLASTFGAPDAAQLARVDRLAAQGTATAWAAEYVRAAGSCDLPALRRLAAA